MSVLGWWGGPYGLIARTPFFGPLGEFFIARNDDSPLYYDVLFRPAGSSEVPHEVVSFPVVGHFPYGYPVAPDN